MCLSRIYIKDKDRDALVVDEAARVINNDGIITVSALLGEEKDLEGYYINEVNLVENYIILKPKEG